MNLYPIDTGLFKLDGGAMFGVVPKPLWSKLHPPDEKNLCTWAMRCLLVETDGHLILIDNGIGDKQDAKFFGHYDLHGDDTLDKSLAKHGFSKDDITDVFLTHLHFDHCGGSIVRQGNGAATLRTNLGRDRLGAGDVEVGDGNGGAFARHGQGLGPPQARGPAGHQCELVCESRHG